MAENNNSKAFTHTAYGFRRQGRKFGVWKEIGDARAELPDGTPVVDVKNATIRVFLDRLTLGFAGPLGADRHAAAIAPAGTAAAGPGRRGG